MLKLTGVLQISCWHAAGGSGRLAPPELVSEEVLKLPVALTAAGCKTCPHATCAVSDHGPLMLQAALLATWRTTRIP